MTAETIADDPPRYAPDGKLWVCLACGKTEVDLYGGANGWDESCMLNARLYPKDVLVFESASKRVVRVTGELR